MDNYQKTIQVRWSDLDPNFHVRHSVYYDWGAFIRISLLTDCGLTPKAMTENHLGPILFREECVFKKEIRHNDSLEMNVQLSRCTEDGGRWTMVHEIWRSGDTLCAVVTVDGAWMDTRARKLTALPEGFLKAFENIPHSPNFEWVTK